MPSVERRAQLSGWNFNCTCSLCSASPEERAQSDRRRYRLRDILMGLTSYSAGTEGLDKLLEETLDMMEKEDMGFLVANYYAGFAWAYLGGSDFENARKYGLLAEEMAERYGQEEDVGQGMGNFWQALKDKMDFQR